MQLSRLTEQPAQWAQVLILAISTSSELRHIGLFYDNVGYHRIEGLGRGPMSSTREYPGLVFYNMRGHVCIFPELVVVSRFSQRAPPKIES